MGPFLSAIQIIGGPLPLVLNGLALVAIVLLLLFGAPKGSSRKRWAITAVLALLIGAGIGWSICWLVGDVLDLFEITFSPGTRLWVTLAFAAMALAAVSLRAPRVVTRVGAVSSIVLFALVGAVGVNADFGQYTTVGSILGLTPYDTMPDSLIANQKAAADTQDAATALWESWRAPADTPAHGKVGSVTIPATVSHFAARQGLVYLPPAALTANPPALPVLIMLSGQPGSPEHIFLAGHFASILDAIARDNGGLAPIVVVPDQLGSPSANPMCVDSPLGNSATYLTVDVPNWIRSTLAVRSDPAGWAIGGFSEGGTCAIQLGAEHPELFGSILDVSGELAPHIGNDANTIAKGFGGSATAYEAAKPLSLLAAHAPYSDVVAVFGVGANDTKYTPAAQTLAAAAGDAGMQVSLFISPGTSHDWGTVEYTVKKGLPIIYRQMGLERPTA